MGKRLYVGNLSYDVDSLRPDAGVPDAGTADAAPLPDGP